MIFNRCGAKRKPDREKELRGASRRSSDDVDFFCMMDGLGDGVLLVDPESQKIKRANAPLRELLGYEEGEMPTLSVWDIHPEASKNLVASVVDEFLNNHKVCTENMPVQRKDGTVFYADITASMVQMDGRDWALGVFRDTTARKQRDDQLRESQEQYRALYDNAPQACQSLDESGCFVDLNAAWLAILGYERDEVLGKSFADFLHPDWAVSFEKKFPILKSVGYVRNVHYKMRHKDGHFVDIELNGCVDHMPDGGFRKTYCVFQDITERKRALEQLKDERQRLAGILEGTDVGTWEWNVQTGALVLNERWAEMLGYSLSELAPISVATWENACCPEDLERCKMLIDRHLKKEIDYYEIDVRMKHRDGSWVWVQARGKVVSWTDDLQPLMMMGTHQDVSERYQMAERLRQTEKMDAIGQLAGGVAHDFNNQLAGVLGYAELLVEELTDPRLISYAGNIIKASNRAAELTSNLLAFGRKGKNRNVPIKVSEVIGEVVSMLERSIDKRIVIIQKLNAPLAEICGDPTQIYNVLLNLGINARDAMPDGGELAYETDVVSLDQAAIDHQLLEVSPGDYICISVLDSGVGMSPEVQRRIFEPFYTTKPECKGTGLGLSSVYGTVKTHNGAIHVNSQLGQGSAFRMYFPVSNVMLDSTEGGSSKPRRGVARILLVDDEPILRELGAEMLGRLGYKVKTCEDGLAGLDYYRDHWRETDLVILDMVMPRLDGYQTFVAMRNINPGVLAILSSGYSMNGKAQSILDEGVKAFVGKPFGRRDLAEVVERVLRSSVR